MDENHRDRAESNSIVTENVRWVLNRKSKLWVPKPKKPFAERMGFAGKTPWDFIQLLLIPLVLAGVGFLFSAQQNQTSLQVSERQHQADLQIAATRYANDQQLAADQQRETTLKTYLDDMSNLLLNNKLLESKPGDAVRQVARERTLTTLRRLEANRNRIVVQFLQDTQLLGGTDAVINLRWANLSNDDLRGVNLIGAHLIGANLSFADLGGAALSDADLNDATLFGANLRDADLSDANLIVADLRFANLGGADLTGADLTDADLTDADLTGAILTNAKLTQVQLNEAKSLQGTIMPDGSKHP